MTGEMCVFLDADGKQVGGGLHWQISMEIISGLGNESTVTNWQASVSKYWFLSKHATAEALFYWVKENTFILATRVHIEFEGVQDELGKIINKKLTMVKKGE